jgi:hypothetical protein
MTVAWEDAAHMFDAVEEYYSMDSWVLGCRLPIALPQVPPLCVALRSSGSAAQGHRKKGNAVFSVPKSRLP